MGYRDDEYSLSSKSVENIERKSAECIPADVVEIRGPAQRRLVDLIERLLEGAFQSGACGDAPLAIPGNRMEIFLALPRGVAR